MDILNRQKLFELSSIGDDKKSGSLACAIMQISRIKKNDLADVEDAKTALRKAYFGYEDSTSKLACWTSELTPSELGALRAAAQRLSMAMQGLAQHDNSVFPVLNELDAILSPLIEKLADEHREESQPNWRERQAQQMATKAETIMAEIEKQRQVMLR
jgi:hypothetical protein